jgi:hypothetical protein
MTMTVQSGQNVLSGFPTSGLIPVDNGGPEVASLPEVAGTVTLNGATPVTVSDTGVTAGSIILFTLKTVGGTVGAYPAVQTITAKTGFTVAGTAGDTSTYNYVRIG